MTIFRGNQNRSMRKIVIGLFIGMISFFQVSAEEGMLIPSLIKAFESDMQAMGMKLSAEDIYSVNNSSLKDAIVHFGGGCTAELVSDKGLLLTNHHCGYSQIQSHSSLENDYIKYGFWASSMAEELPNNGLTAARIVRIDDVTKTIFSGTDGLEGEELEAKIKSNMETLIMDATNGNHYEAMIRAFNYGNDYYMIVQEVFEDVRLVGAPPSSVGKFGGDTDNWVWPRHTGDFSVFRIYAGADNKPAPYNESNQPYKPLHFFPVSVRDRMPGEFTMVYGFPGTTEQHLVSDHLKYIMDKERPARIKMREKSLAVIDAGMKSSDLIRIKYASKQARIANGWKKWIGQLGGLQAVNALQIKQDREAAYLKMANKKSSWKEEFGAVIDEMKALVAAQKENDFAYVMDVEYMFIGPEVFKRARMMYDFLNKYDELEESGALKETIEKMIKGAHGFYKDYDEMVDMKIFTALTDEYKALKGNYDYSVNLKNFTGEELAKQIFDQSVLTSEERFVEFMENLDEESINEFKGADISYLLWSELWENFVGNVIPKARAFDSQMESLLKTYVKGKMEMFPNDKHWPDANSTMRITYGKLEGSAPHDGMMYTEHTTLDGILAKHQTGNSDFELLDDFKVLAESKDYAGYDQNGELWVCFTGSNHTTGGNSGSPVIDAEGNLMGLNFDRSWESTMSDYMFDADRCRNIVVDIRYVLWIMDRYAGAGHLVDEMTLVKGKSPAASTTKKCRRKRCKCKK